MRKHHLRKLTRDQQCQVRQAGCTWDTALLAHSRRGNIGMVKKTTDLCGVYACQSCHDKIDGRCNPDDRATDREILDAMCRTLEFVGKELEI